MRLASLAGRAVILTTANPDEGLRGVDVAKSSGGRFGPSIADLYRDWEEFRAWVATGTGRAGEADPVDLMALENPAPAPSQIFAIGLNYLDHAAEAKLDATRDLVPPTFTKFSSSLAGPFAAITLPSDKVDWEAELVVVIGKHADHVEAAQAWSHIAGLAVGQDYSERAVQVAGAMPQFSLGKSYPGFGPVGPWLVTPDEVPNPNDLELTCEINGEQVQKGRTSAMVWSVPDLIATLSTVCPLAPGDVIFTGTPAGVGFARSPQRFLNPGDVVVTRIDGVGEIRQECRARG